MCEFLLAEQAKVIGIADILVFIAFIAAVLAVGFIKSGNKEHESQTSEDYFLAGRGLTWWLVGFSLIAANISTEQFVGMSGQAADWLGMAIASYEWMAAITLVVVAFVFLPKFLKCGIYTIPEFLEHRFSPIARWVMAAATLVILVGVPTASVIYSGAKVICVNFDGINLFGLDFGNITVGCWIIGTLAAIYVFVGGLKACAWADLLQGSALVLGGVIIAIFAFNMLADKAPEELIKTSVNSELTAPQLTDAGPIDRFIALNKAELPDGKLHMVRGADDASIPWTALVIGLWIPNFFYWGLNQYIMQRSLGSKSLAEGQKGVVFAAFLKLIIPFVVVIPGILAFNLFSTHLGDLAVDRNRSGVELVNNYFNDSVKAQFAAKEEMIYVFNEDFAKTEPELVKELVAFNLKLTNQEKEIPADPAALVKFNNDIADNAGDIKSSELLAMYLDTEQNFLEKFMNIFSSDDSHKTEIIKFKEAFADIYPEITKEIVAKNAIQLAKDVVSDPIESPTASDYSKIVAAHATKLNKEMSEIIKDALDLKDGEIIPAIDDKLELAKVNSIFVNIAEADANEEVYKLSSELVGYDFDAAFPTLIKKLLPVGNGLKGFVLAAIFGAVVSSLASMLNSASTIFTMDVFAKIKKDAQQDALIKVGRVCVIVFVLIAMLIAPTLGSPKLGGIFNFIQEFQGFLSPGILAVFIFGLLVPRTPKFAGTLGIILNVFLYGLFKFSPSVPGLKSIGILNTIAEMAFLNRMALCFGICLAVIGIMTILKPEKEAVVLPVNENMDVTSSASAKFWGIVVCIMTVILYIIFW